jgi:hypothetical protein
MKSLFFAAAILAATAPAMAATDVNVSITTGSPNFYGRIDIGNLPQPRVINVEPIIIRSQPRMVAPIYLRVPPGHIKHWSKHCARYNACGQRVYFVHDEWYNGVYAPHARGEHGEGRDAHGEGKGHGKGHDKGHAKGHDND